MNRKIVAIVGSSKFKDQHLGVAQRETLRGNVVLLAGFWHHKDMVPITDEQKEHLDRLMLDKVRMSTEVFVVNVNGYIGQSTQRAIELARDLDKPTRYLEPVDGGAIEEK
jgi:hypothetical protein